MNLFNNPLFLLGVALTIVGQIGKDIEGFQNYIFYGGLTLVGLSLVVHVKPLKFQTV